MMHEIEFTIPPRALGRSDVRFDVKTSNGVLGSLAVSKGSLVWFPKKASYGLKMSWEELDRLMRINGSRSERR